MNSLISLSPSSCLCVDLKYLSVNSNMWVIPGPVSNDAFSLDFGFHLLLLCFSLLLSEHWLLHISVVIFGAHCIFTKHRQIIFLVTIAETLLLQLFTMF